MSRRFGGAEHRVRLFRYLEGVPLSRIRRRPPALLDAVGALAGRLQRALAGFSHPGLEEQAIPWAPRHAATVIEAAAAVVPDPGRRALYEKTAAWVLPELPGLLALPAVAIHNDANDDNLMLTRGEPEAASPERLALLDFGDAVRAPAVVEAATAALYAGLASREPLRAAARVLAGFARERPLGEAESDRFRVAVAARALVSAGVAALRRARIPGTTSDPYLLVSEVGVWRFLTALAAEPPPVTTGRFRLAAGHEPLAGRVRRAGVAVRAAKRALAPIPLGDHPRRLDLSPENAEVDPEAGPESLRNLVAATDGRRAVGRHLEPRLPEIAPESPLPDPAAEPRTVSLGIEVFAPAGTPVRAPLGGEVVGRTGDLRDAPTRLRHEAEGVRFETVYRGLDRDPGAGARVRRGDPLGRIASGAPDGWPPHLHFQVTLADFDGAPPRRVSPADAPLLGALTPDPAEFFGLWELGPAPSGELAARGKSSPHPRRSGRGTGIHPDSGMRGTLPTGRWVESLPRFAPPSFAGRGNPPRTPPRRRCAPHLYPGDFHHRLLELQLTARRRHFSRALSIAYDDPIGVVRGRGARLYDGLGRDYLDMVNNVCHVGHAHPRVAAAIARQARLLNTNTRYLYRQLTDYAERLAATLPDPLAVVFLTNSGSEANDLALRLARAHLGRRETLVFEGGYHGNLSSLIEVSPYKLDGKGGGPGPEWLRRLPLPDGYRGRFRSGEPAFPEALIADARERVRAAGPATLIAEAIPSCGGQIVPPPGYLRSLYRAVREAGGVIVADEVQTGFFRVGPAGWAFASVQEPRAPGIGTPSRGIPSDGRRNGAAPTGGAPSGAGPPLVGTPVVAAPVVGPPRVGTPEGGRPEGRPEAPDIVTLGKPAGNGHPLGAVVTTRAVSRSFETGMEYFNTFGGNPVSCAAGLAVLEVIEEEGLAEHAEAVGNRLLEGLAELSGRYPILGDVRGRGLFLGFELVRDPDTRTPATAEARRIVNRLREFRILNAVDGPDANVVKIKPPLVFSHRDADRYLSALEIVLREQL